MPQILQGYPGLAQSLYDKYGGFGTVNKIVLTFYDAVLDSEQIGDFFEDIDMPRLIDHQTKFMASLLGGPASFSDEHLRRAHRGMEISDAHYDELKDILRDSLGANGVSAPDIDTVLAKVEHLRQVVRA